jgi:hypothetical protein
MQRNYRKAAKKESMEVRLAALVLLVKNTHSEMHEIIQNEVAAITFFIFGLLFIIMGCVISETENRVIRNKAGGRKRFQKDGKGGIM